MDSGDAEMQRCVCIRHASLSCAILSFPILHIDCVLTLTPISLPVSLVRMLSLSILSAFDLKRLNQTPYYAFPLMASF